MGKIITNIKFICLFGLFLFSLPLAAHGQPNLPLGNEEKINSFHSDINVETDGSITVIETINVTALGDNIRRGIYRDFPTSYSNGFTRTKVDFEVISVKKNNSTEPYHLESLSNGVRIYIGSENEFLQPGIYEYEITYWTNNQLGFFENHDELYWNVTGQGWEFPIEQTSAVVTLPEIIQQENIRTDGFTGYAGDQEKNYVAEVAGNTVSFQTTGPLLPYQGLTIVVGWPKGVVTQPTDQEKIEGFILGNLGILAAILGLLAIFVYYIISWRKVGKDPEKGTIIPHYEPPAELTPAATRYVKNMKFDNKIFAAQLIQMAIKGYLIIVQKKTFLKNNYSISKSGQALDQVLPEEKTVFDILFDAGSAQTLELQNKNYKKIQKASLALENHLEQSAGKFFKLNRPYSYAGVIFSFAVLALVIVAENIASSGAVQILLIIFTAIVLLAANILFLWLIKAPTKKGRQLLDHIEGFKWFLSVTEKDRMNFHNPPDKTPELFEKYLPYALALEVEQKWAEQFSGVFDKLADQGRPYNPAWYAGAGFTTGNIGSFSNSLGGAFASSVSSASQAPGSSSGFSGGGSAGGGGGGGGGGGW